LSEIVINFGSEYGSGSTVIRYSFTASTTYNQNIRIDFDNILYDDVSNEQIVIRTGVTINAGSLIGESTVTLTKDYSRLLKGFTEFLEVESSRPNTTFNKYAKVNFENYVPITARVSFLKCCPDDPGEEYAEADITSLSWYNDGGGIVVNRVCYLPTDKSSPSAIYAGIRYGADFFGNCEESRVCSCYVPPSPTPTSSVTKTPTPTQTQTLTPTPSGVYTLECSGSVTEFFLDCVGTSSPYFLNCSGSTIDLFLECDSQISPFFIECQSQVAQFFLECSSDVTLPFIECESNFENYYLECSGGFEIVTPTMTPTQTNTPTLTNTQTVTPTQTSTITQTITRTTTRTPTRTSTPTRTQTPEATKTPLPVSASPTPTPRR